jgi:cell division septation protein DedD
MTRMANPEQPRDDLDDDDERFEDDGRRSIFSALWFRAILVVVVLGVVAAVAVPYVLEVANEPPAKPAIIAKPESSPPTSTPAPQPPAATAPSPPPSPPPVADKPATSEKPAMERPAPAPTPPSTTEKPTTTERPATTAKKSDAAPSPAAKEQTAPRAGTPTNSSAGASSGGYFVQVGAFKSSDLAKRLAARLREAKYTVEESATNSAPVPAAAPAPSAAPPTAGGDKYDVYVTGGTAPEINAKLSTRGLSSEPSSGGVVVKPSLTLREAVALSKDLAVDGLKVQVRRAAGTAAATAVAPTRPAPSGDTVYRVRVGPFDDRAGATSTLRELEQRGYTPFIARGGQ